MRAYTSNASRVRLEVRPRVSQQRLEQLRGRRPTASSCARASRHSDPGPPSSASGFRFFPLLGRRVRSLLQPPSPPPASSPPLIFASFSSVFRLSFRYCFRASDVIAASIASSAASSSASGLSCKSTYVSMPPFAASCTRRGRRARPLREASPRTNAESTSAGNTVEIELVLLRVLVVRASRLAKYFSARAAAARGARGTAPRRSRTTAHCMSYKLDAWSPSRVNSATVFSASSCSPHCSSRRTQTLLRNRSARSAARCFFPNPRRVSQRARLLQEGSPSRAGTRSSTWTRSRARRRSSRARRRRRPSWTCGARAARGAWTRHDDGSFSFSFSFSPSPCAGGKAPVFFQRLRDVLEHAPHDRRLLVVRVQRLDVLEQRRDALAERLLRERAELRPRTRRPDEYSNGNRLIVSHRGCFTPSSSYQRL